MIDCLKHLLIGMLTTMYKSFSIKQPSFEFKDNKLEVQCAYSFDKERNFIETYTIDFGGVEEIYIDEIPSYIELVAIAAAPSYYKASPTLQVVIDFPIAPQVLEWATTLFDEGLREFRFQNNLDLNKTPIFITIDKEIIIASEIKSDPNLVLLPIGGGKDSVTSLEILTKTNTQVVGFSIGDHEAINNTAKAASIPLIRVNRQLDKDLFEWNKQGALNGHVPVTAVTSTLACLAGYCIGASSAIMSNESSANEATRVEGGVEVNHQYSKSFKAEKDLRKALNAHTLNTINYFSLLRTLSEYEIFSIFSKAIKFHKVFTSCNRVFKIDEKSRSKSWCGNCDKCRFVFIGLCAFLEIEEVVEIFGQNLFDNKDNISGFLELIGMGEGKPFECVGTIGETVLLMKKALNKIDSKNVKKLNNALAEIKDIDFLSKNTKLNIEFGLDNFVPDEFSKTISDLKLESYKSEVLAKLEGETIGVIGLGRDTAGIIRFLENVGYKNGIMIYLPDDQNISDEDFQKANEELLINDVGFARKCIRNFEDLSKCSLIFVSPGVSKYSELVVSFEEEVTTPLAWWLALNKELLPQKIFVGITGTKGKSTTASMLAHVLEDSVLVGNIGNSVGSLPLEDLLKTRYVVLEVSSFQASYVTVSPHVGILTSLFDCHIDWHLTPKNYEKDKRNLFAHGCDTVISSEVERSQSLTLKQQNENTIEEVADLIALQMTKENIQEKLNSFPGLKYRKEIIAEKNGVIYISDVLATAPHASAESLIDISKTYPDAKVFLLYGGANRNVDQSSLIKVLNSLKLNYVVITLPETGHEIEQKLKNYQHCDELEDGIFWASKNAKKGDVVLLAPGGPSFHRYKNYEKLHEHFVELVDKL